jgi:hypothetical protein
MEEQDFQRVVEFLGKMTKAQLTEIRRRTLSLISGKEEGGVANRDWLLDAVLEVVRERGLGHAIPPNFRIRKTSSFGGYETQADRVRMMLSEAIPDMEVTEERAIGVIAVRALADYIAPWSEVTFDSLLHNVAKIPEAIDAAFPGYLQAGMLSFLLRDRRK